MRFTSGSTRPGPADCRVRPEHLKDLSKIQALLTALNDPYANIAKLVVAIPVLAARCIVRAAARSKLDIATVDQALNLIGNKGLESELLVLLEDLTILKAETEA
ncbi:MAG TPA: hypothetical protein VFQ61_18265 [Polyangiaceae bacterium]|nr:hypothetical protein [Polyangiaceae bacterium]